MAILGAHMSIAGGHHKAVEIAERCGCDCLQLFTKNSNQWRARPISDDESQRFRTTLAQSGLRHVIAHDSYLINLASPDDALWQRSIDAFVVELARAEQLGIEYVVTHPGASVGAGEAEGLARVAAALDEVHRRTEGLRARALLETTAGQGTSLGWRFEHLAQIMALVRHSDRLGVCVDTCHIFAAGYRLGTRRDYRATIAELEGVIGLARVRAFHLNDSRRELGSRVDRHAAIGEGHLGIEPFRHLLNDPRFRKVPMYLETPKGGKDGIEFDLRNLATLRGLVKKTKSKVNENAKGKEPRIARMGSDDTDAGKKENKSK